MIVFKQVTQTLSPTAIGWINQIAPPQMHAIGQPVAMLGWSGE